ncbi:MAG: flagellar hook-associated protein 1 FlgK [Gallionellaceae bacterium]|nr:MAG: flagellar hook-associated protein 1 FlgK [Gallionellaceae bacterium]
MGIGIYGIGASALNAAQIGLATTEHNIANANTPGYSRQLVETGARLPQLFGSGYVGQGADVVAIKRAYNEFLSGQVMSEQAQASHLDAYYSQIKQIDNLLANPTAGISSALQDFFNAANGVSSLPESVAARQTMLGSAQFLAARFQSLNQRLADANNNVNSQIGLSVANINSLAKQIAALNHGIVMAQNVAAQPPNDLLDKRDQLVALLNQEIKAGVIKQSDGSYNVYIGNGQSLVVGTQSFSLQAVQSLADPSKLEVAYSDAATGSFTRLQQNSLQGGQLGGLIEFRTNTLDGAQNSIGLVAMGVAGLFNAQHQLGQDLTGALGGSFFVQSSPVASASSDNAANGSTAVVSASVADYSALTGSDYSLKYNGAAAGYTLRRLSDNTVTTFASLPQTVDGLAISSTAGGVAGDVFLIRPTVNGSRDFAVAITDPVQIAAAAPIRTGAALTNTGTGKISAGAVNPAPSAADPIHPATDLNLRQPVTIAFSTATSFTVTGTGVPGSPVTVAYTPGADISYNGWTAQITGSPSPGDTFTVGANTGATADSRNALLLAGLQIQNTLSGGVVTFQGAYSQLVSQIGNKTRELDVTSQAQASMVQLTMQEQQSVSGVNLDEEAANLMRYQRAYQAAGKALQVANSLFDLLLSLGE